MEEAMKEMKMDERLMDWLIDQVVDALDKMAVVTAVDRDDIWETLKPVVDTVLKDNQ